MNFFRNIMERPMPLTNESPRKTERDFVLGGTEYAAQPKRADATPAQTQEIPQENAARVELPSVEVPDETADWFDAYAEVLDYLNDESDHTNQLAAVGRIDTRAPGYAKKWASGASEQALHQLLAQASQEACKLGEACVELVKNGKRDMGESTRLKNQLAKHSDILLFVESSNAGNDYKPAYDYLRGVAVMAGIA